jgi:carbamoyl-phosphate synthase large subunit
VAESRIGQVLLEESLLGWGEFELEVIRDRADNVVIVCSIENLDPMGVHTGDSVCVAPAMTLSDREYQALRDAAATVIRTVGVETGGSNVQFAVNRQTGEIAVIEMNPRVSRSSALASKATGYPIAKVATKLAVGYTLDEIPNDLTGTTPASFEPSLDYVVVKFPRFAFEKFRGADTTLGTQMKSVGEAMGSAEPSRRRSGRRSLARARRGGRARPGATSTTCPRISTPGSGASWSARRGGAAAGAACLPPRRLLRGRGRRGVELLLLHPRRGDEAPPAGDRPRVVILGSGPNRIGRGSSSTTAASTRRRAFRALGYEAVMVNCNPETVSTDYDTSDRLYFEPLHEESVLACASASGPDGVVDPVRRPDAAQLAGALEAAVPDHGDAVRGDRPRRGAASLRAAARGARRPLPGVGDGEGRGRGGGDRGRDRLPGARAAELRARRRSMRVCDDERRCGPRSRTSRARCWSTASSRGRSRSTSTRSATASPSTSAP